MRAVLQPAQRGRKHRCSACGAAFYDLERELSACPKCETPYEVAHMPRGEPARKRQSWNKGARRPEPGAEVPEAPAEEASEGVLDAVDDTDDAETADDADEENQATDDDADKAETPGRDQI